MDLKKGKLVLHPNQDKDTDLGNQYYAFVDGIETLENDRTIIQFDCVKAHQIDNLGNVKPSFDQFDEFDASIIVCDFSDNVFQEFMDLFEEPFNEEDWLILYLTYQPNQFKATVIPEYDEETPAIYNRYLKKDCKKVGQDFQKKLEGIFYLQMIKDF